MSEPTSIQATLARQYRIHRGWFGYLAVFVIAFLLFANFQHVNVFADPDSYYHAAMGVQLRDGHFSTSFAALPYTTLAHAYADQHFLYHFLIAPFAALADPLIGLKLLTVVLGSLMALTFYWFLRRWNVPWAFAATMLLLMVNPFTFRMNLAKASSLSLTLLILGLAAAFSYRYWLLGVLSFAYVWFYGGFPLLVFSVVLFAIVSAAHRKIMRRQDSNTLVHRIRALLGRSFRHQRIRRLNLRIAVAVIVGTVLGLVLNPFFPSNIRFYFDQLVRIGIMNYQHVIGVGGEWYPYHFIELIANTVLVSIPLVIALVLFVLFIKRQSSRSITLFFLWLFFFVLTLKSRRYVEYYVPFSMLFVAMSLKDSVGEIKWKDAWRSFTHDFLGNFWARIGIVAVATYCLILLPTIVVRDYVSEKKDLANGFPIGMFQEESTWIKDHGTAGSIVFHSDWDEFPVLYYYNSSSRYIAGLDPTFLYVQDKDRYHQWVSVTLGTATGDIHAIVRGAFDADFVLVAHDHIAMKSLIESDARFMLAFTGHDANVYTVQ